MAPAVQRSGDGALTVSWKNPGQYCEQLRVAWRGISPPFCLFAVVNRRQNPAGLRVGRRGFTPSGDLEAGVRCLHVYVFTRLCVPLWVPHVDVFTNLCKHSPTIPSALTLPVGVGCGAPLTAAYADENAPPGGQPVSNNV